VDLCIYSPVYLHGAVLNQLSTAPTSTLPMLNSVNAFCNSDFLRTAIRNPTLFQAVRGHAVANLMKTILYKPEIN
jgi:hypothetical protein